MSTLGEVLIGLAIAAGLAGIVMPVLPGLLLIVAALIVWALVTGGAAWWVALAALSLAVVGTIVKYTIPKRQLNESGMPNRTLVLAMVAAIMGFFLIPVIGAFIGFIGAIYISERARVGPQRAWPATRAALRAVATSIGIELVTGVLIAGIWLATVLFS